MVRSLLLLRVRAEGIGPSLPPQSSAFVSANMRRSSRRAALWSARQLLTNAACLPSRTLPLSKPVLQNGLVLNRVELDDFAETHRFRLAIRFVGQKLVQFLQ